jgi:hypothetical protein
MITIIADRYSYTSPPPGALVARQIGDYVAIRQHIRRSLDQDEALTVYTANPVVLGWLSDLRRYPEARLRWQVIDTSDEFMRLFGVMPTPPFSPERIAALRLDELPPVPNGAVVRPLTWVLGHHLGVVWQHDQPSASHLLAIVTWAIQQTAPLPAEIVPLVQAQLKYWAEKEPIYDTLEATSLGLTSRHVLMRWALRRYASPWRSTQVWGALPLLDSEPAAVLLVELLRSEHQVIQTYWQREMTGTVIDGLFVVNALEQMSGFSEAEFQALLTMLERSPNMLEQRLVEAIYERFAHLPIVQTSLRNLAQKIAPPDPVLPDRNWSVERWMYWATHEYMPYYAWVIQHHRGQEHQQACALVYSDWLYSQYPGWLNDERSPLVLRQYQKVLELIAQDTHNFVLWLVIDGMTWWQGDLIREIGEQHGLYVQAHTPAIAMLPSITSVSKRALVTGQSIIDIALPNIAEAARAKFERSNLAGVVTYDIPAIVETIRQKPQLQVALVLFNLIDALAHQTTNFTDDAGIRGYLDGIIRQLVAIQRVCAAQGRQMHILIGSDHGSTLLPQDAPKVALPSAVREVDDLWEPEVSSQQVQKPGTRAASTDLLHIPSLDVTHWYALDRDQFQLDKHYVAPRGYGYIKRRPTGWTHGGLTPEETVVPMIQLAAERPTVLVPELIFSGTLRVGQAGILRVVVRNINRFPLQQFTLSLAVATKPTELATLNGLETQEIELSTLPIAAQGSELIITYEVRYNAFGNLHRNVGQATLPLRRLQTDDNLFDDMFN